MKKKTLREKIGECFLVGTLGLMIPINFYIVGNDIYSHLTADKKIVFEEKNKMFQSPISIYGFDRNKDGQIDEIKEHFVRYYSTKAMFPIQRTYIQGDK